MSPLLTQKKTEGRPKARWKNDVENGIKSMDMFNWRRVTRDKDGWKRATRDMRIRLGQWSNRKIRRRRKLENTHFC